MARQPNYKRMYRDAVNLLKVKKECLPKEEVGLEIPEDFKEVGLPLVIELMMKVQAQISYFEINKSNRLVPPTLKTLYGRLLKVTNDMDKINKTLVKEEIGDYEEAYNRVMKEIAEVEKEIKEQEFNVTIE